MKTRKTFSLKLLENPSKLRKLEIPNKLFNPLSCIDAIFKINSLGNLIRQVKVMKTSTLSENVYIEQNVFTRQLEYF